MNELLSQPVEIEKSFHEIFMAREGVGGSLGKQGIDFKGARFASIFRILSDLN